MDGRRWTLLAHRLPSMVHRPVITLLTSGTRGDVLPYIALGKGLLEAGYNIRIAAPHGFANLIQSHRVPFAPFDGNPTDLLIEQGNSTPMTLGTNPIRSFQATRNFLQKARPLYRRMLHTAAEACRGSDLLIHGLPTLWGAHIAEGLGIPAVRALLQPFAPTREFPSALLPFRFSLSGIGNWLSHWAVTQAIWLSWRSEINHARHADFGLAPAHWLDPSLRADSHQPLTLNAFSEHVVPRPKDWNEKQIITGYWRVGELENWQPGASTLLRFIDSADNLIAIGFGSPGMRGYLSVLEEALNMANAQAVLTLPAKWHGMIKSKNIFPIEYIPHDWLYPRVKVAVHHGGAGTTSASLHAGIPTITLPLAIDQFFWGERIHKLGAGLSIPQRKLSAKNLAQAITEALNNKEMHAKAKEICETLNQEDGVQTAIQHLTTDY
ncbi:MAG: glycosyltransferase [Chloroflexi bacterium]|nr:glycosyltransferase [Chloroflexota bacterium]MDL1944168.1 glycosyltransferase family 1 protein [Chloroflexi bacterium CFX2]